MAYQNFIGIDIGKCEFVVGLDSDKKTKSFGNNQTGWNDFVDEYRPYLDESLTVLESTGGYEKELLLFLCAEGFDVHRADTRKVKNFIRSFGKYAKTDAIDALALARYGKERSLNLGLYCVQTKTQELLKLLAERRLDLTKMLTQEKNRAQAPLNKPLKRNIETVIRCLEKQIKLVNKEMDTIVSEDEELAKKRQILETIPGIGSVTAKAVLAFMPELGQLDRKKVASLAGLAPHPKQSGQRTWYTPTVGGRRDLRPILFLAAMGARRSKGTYFSAFYEKLTATGKKKMVALTAVMRKIIVIANAKIRDEFYLAKDPKGNLDCRASLAIVRAR